MPGAGLGLAATRPGATPEGLATLQIGAGLPYAHTAPGFREGQATEIQRAHIAAGPGHAQVAESRRQFEATPVTVMAPDGLSAVFAPRSQVTAPGAAFRPVLTQDQQQGVVSGRLAAGQDVPNAPMILAPAQVTANAGAASRAAVEPVAVMRDGRRVTVPRGQLTMGDVLVGTTDSPLDMAAQARLAGQALDMAPLEDAARLAAASRAQAAPRPVPPPLDVSPHDAAGLERALTARFAAVYGQPPDAGQLAALVGRAGVYYQQTRNAGRAVDATMEDVGAAAPETRGVWNPLSTNRTTLTRPLPVARDLGGLGAVLAPPLVPVVSGQPTAGAVPAAAAAPLPAVQAEPSGQAGVAPGALPPAARARLREGINTQFANGQTWTLRNGVPVQVR